MLDVIVNILDLITGFFELIAEFVKDIFNLAVQARNAFEVIPTMLGFFPAEIVTAFLSIFVVVVVYKILGREG